jgi:predicted nucleotidyltransferase
VSAARFEVAEHAIFAALAGSQAHGTARVDSDVDVRGVCIAPLAVRVSIAARFEQHEGPLEGALQERLLPRLHAHPTAASALDARIECVVFDVAKFVELCAAANPNALEILFADPADWLLDTPLWQRLYAERARFVTRRIQDTFLGYAMAQLKRIRTHRAWLLHPPARKPGRADFGLPEAHGTLSRDDQDRIEQAIAERLRSYGLDHVDLAKSARIALQERMTSFWTDVLRCDESALGERLRDVATGSLELPRDVVTALNAERRYQGAMRQWESYETWKRRRNPARAELERQHGYDTKHAQHLVRLMRMGLEALRTGELCVRRPDADELVAIRDGALSYDALLALAEDLRQQMTLAAQTSSLPEALAPEVADALVLDLIESVVRPLT